ncbi:SpoIIE family protein phosphatase [Mycolicibacterium chubuense]|uniref:SpoIIE family protein phosphatase n=1 Tax=Mycolicibacterium chubuense TaxID=1800 RepID=UPI001EEFC7F6|nr:SpoIIE family protein phosphatase [Mycolicibacterium chubuense]
MGILVVLAVVAALSMKTQTAGLTTPALWPASGIALGLGIRFPRRYTWILAVGVAAVTLLVLLWAGRPAPLAIFLSAGAALEMAAGTLLLRGRRDRSPRFAKPGDLAKFLVIAVVASMLYGLTASVAFFLFANPATALETLETGLLKHVAGMALLTPLFMAPPRRRQPAGYAEAASHVVASLAVATGVFLFGDTLPLAFLTFLPIVGAALRLSTRLLSVLMVGVTTIAAAGSAHGMGPFAFDYLGARTGTVLLQVFQVSMVAVFLTLSLVVGAERDMSSRLYDSEELFRKSFNSSVAGKLMVVRSSTQWNVERANPSGQDLLPGLREGARLDTLIGEEAAARLSAVADSLIDGNARLTLKLADGRSLDMSVAVIGERPEGTLFVLHFHDVTEAERVRQLEQEEMNRAAEVQRALLPSALPAIPGWMFGSFTIPARQVGGDFYDVRVDEPSIVLSLGDVMGKGMDAGMLAAATRAALRSHDPATSPSDVVNRAANILDADLRRISAFVTLAYVLVDMESGDFRFTDAGHGLHFVVRTGSGRVERLVSDDMPLGLGDRWRELYDSLAPGDMILLVSDGVMDRWGGSLEGLEEAIARCAKRDGMSPQAVVDSLCADAGDVLDGDDITAVALCRAG